MVDQETIKHAITSEIYECLFGLNRDEVIRTAQVVAGSHWGVIPHGGDLDEQARDWMSIEALNALSHVESSFSRKLNRLAMPLTMEQACSLVRLTCRGYEVSNVWQAS